MGQVDLPLQYLWFFCVSHPLILAGIIRWYVDTQGSMMLAL